MYTKNKQNEERNRGKIKIYRTFLSFFAPSIRRNKKNFRYRHKICKYILYTSQATSCFQNTTRWSQTRTVLKLQLSPMTPHPMLPFKTITEAIKRCCQFADLAVCAAFRRPFKLCKCEAAEHPNQAQKRYADTCSLGSAVLGSKEGLLL